MKKEDSDVLPGFKEGRFARWLRRVVHPVIAGTPMTWACTTLVFLSYYYWGMLLVSGGTYWRGYLAIMVGVAMMIVASVAACLQIASEAVVDRHEDAEMAAADVVSVRSLITGDLEEVDEID